MAPDLHPADAAAKTSDENMQGDAVQTNAPSAVPSGKSIHSTSAQTRGAHEMTRRDVHTASSLEAQRRFPPASAKVPNLAHQAALRRSSIKKEDPASASTPESTSSNKSGPVLVCKPLVKADMSKRSKPKVHSDSPRMPPLESFSFQDILASIGPEGDASIEAIAEICGRTKMSLAEEHASHLPPQSQLVAPGSSPADSIPSMRLETVEEVQARRPHTRSHSRSLALTSSQTGITGDATAATSPVTSHVHHGSSKISLSKVQAMPESTQAPLLAQVLAWLRGSSSEVANITEPSAAGTLQTMVRKNDSVRA